ncbi:MAG: hypothetical protein E7214_14960 [Clostridium sp.]|nr:hypothetical protein [Clostridium sp.]
MSKKTSLVPTMINLSKASRGYDVAITYDEYDIDDTCINTNSRKSATCTKIKNPEMNEVVEKLYSLLETYINKE